MKKMIYLIISIIYGLIMFLAVVNVINIGSQIIIILSSIYGLCSIIQILTLKRKNKIR